MTMSHSGDMNENRNSTESMRRTAQASEKAARTTADETTRMAEAAVGAGNRAVQTGTEMLQRNAETLQHTIQSGAKLAARMTERSADQFGRAMGFSGEEAQKAAHRSTGNIEAIMHSSTVVSEITQRLCGEWVDFARQRMERDFDRIDTLMKSRTPQDFVALQSDLMRDNVESFLGYVRRIGEQSLRVVDEAKKGFEGRRVA
jgi:hypothetical protein